MPGIRPLKRSSLATASSRSDRKTLHAKRSARRRSPRRPVRTSHAPVRDRGNTPPPDPGSGTRHASLGAHHRLDQSDPASKADAGRSPATASGDREGQLRSQFDEHEDERLFGQRAQRTSDPGMEERDLPTPLGPTGRSTAERSGSQRRSHCLARGRRRAGHRARSRRTAPAPCTATAARSTPALTNPPLPRVSAAKAPDVHLGSRPRRPPRRNGARTRSSSALGRPCTAHEPMATALPPHTGSRIKRTFQVSHLIAEEEEVAAPELRREGTRAGPREVGSGRGSRCGRPR